MVLKMMVYARTRFVAFHQWENAPEEYKYLALPHRHEFHVEAGVKVNLTDRQEEFHHLKANLGYTIESLYGKNLQHSGNVGKGATEPLPEPIKASCELIAMQIGADLRKFNYDVSYVNVSEDGECGGRIEYD